VPAEGLRVVLRSHKNALLAREPRRLLLIHMKVLLTGATGAGQSSTVTPQPHAHKLLVYTAGLGILRTLLSDNAVSQVTYIGRRPLPSWIVLPGGTSTGDASPTHPKLSTIEHKHFLTYPPALQETIAQHDACVWALGISAVGLSEEKYSEITVGYLDAFLDVLKGKRLGTTERPFRVVFVSGLGADSEEKSRMLFARIKVRNYYVTLTRTHSFLCSRVVQKTT